ncbi:exodeoxyribonuclease V subunit beta [Thiothrix nivea]|uniref:RecBCD enzyme subunit RecB n=1 Tax=Thiothrix nivea (strain ATCC 35100 / DSM 5205 / JP2) TaxID=870187 RepID=A0A656H948_THINJ|nr:exodeoxyribonuclease V subunit beta [Thiothrix nivea]EIJ33301.1 DNA helicase/exodeoxyribonuclease V, beta subunit [Thiothrix nivea DSM 5205]
MQMQTLDAKCVPLEGTNLIEASAGTGKTWTISWLYLRLVAVYGLKVDQILVVTYTEAATAELRDRIRKRLVDALAFLERRACAEVYETLLAETELAVCIQRLQLALVSFDEAAVFTIHGFCKRVLGENAFEARLPFESELVANEDGVLTELTDKFWYQYFLTPDPLHLRLLQKHGLTPDGLLGDVRNFIGKPYLQADIPAATAEAFAGLQSTFDAVFRTCQEIWMQERQAVTNLLLSGVLNGNSYSKRNVPNWADKLDLLFAGETRLGDVHETVARFSTAALSEKTKDGKTTPVHAFFRQIDTLLDAWSELHGSEQAALENLRLQLLLHLRRELPLRKQQLGILTFDDLLLHLHTALEQHPHLAPRLAAKYRAALIDEFQDTDPIQYEIFARIYRDSAEQRVFYVGDPKQAIYGFRGADIYTYLQAAQAVTHSHTLKQNFRSHNGLLQALNHLFRQSANPFRSEIRYEPIEAGKDQASIFLSSPLEGEGAGLKGIPSIRLWDWYTLDEGFNNTAVQENIAAAVANDIARLLNAARQGAATIGDRPIRSSDIAVLVRENRQGELVKQALLERGIASVQKSRDSIFCTREATELRAVLRAVAEPGNELALKQALVTELFGFTASALHTLDEEPALLEAQLEAFQRWHQTWHTQGFMPMFRQWMQQCNGYAHLLALADGERRLTNLLHLAELIHTESRLHGHGMHALIRWLQQRAITGGQDEAHELRLESDENLVQITTIHKSKGLEYGIVYCPFLWLERSPTTGTWFSWHDAKVEGGMTRLQAGSLASDDAERCFREAEQAENLRLLYVALTRAKYHCTIALVSGRINQFDYYSALGWLLFGKLEQGRAILGKLRKDGMQPGERQTLMHQQLQAIVAGGEGHISHELLSPAQPMIRYQVDSVRAEPRIRHYHHRLPPVPRVGSFSGLAAGKEDERPDYDTLAWQAPLEHEAARTAFPRGAKAGSCLHKMLEELDFTQPLADQHDKVLLPALKRHGLPERWLAAAETLLANTLDTQLFVATRLADLPKERRLDELEFYFPVGHLQLKRLQTLLHQHLPAEWADIHAAIDRLKFSTLTGFMKGFIDLVFEAGGQYYVVDYKSNELGATAQEYTPAAMREAMAEHHYYLQYLIYCLALHRYLRQRVSGYDWDTHVGGALYLFLRGMTPVQPGSGVFFHKPDTRLMTALDQLFQ